jgi:hypothetical protein
LQQSWSGAAIEISRELIQLRLRGDDAALLTNQRGID